MSSQPARLPVSAACCSGLTPAHGRALSTQPAQMQHRARASRAPGGRGWPSQLAAIEPGRHVRSAVHVPMRDRRKRQARRRVRADEIERLAVANQRRRHRRPPARIERPRHHSTAPRPRTPPAHAYMRGAAIQAPPSPAPDAHRHRSRIAESRSRLGRCRSCDAPRLGRCHGQRITDTPQRAGRATN